MFYIIEDVIEENLTNKLSNNNFFGQFVDIKDAMIGDSQVFHCDAEYVINEIDKEGMVTDFRFTGLGLYK